MMKCTRCGVPVKGGAAVSCPKCRKPLKKNPPKNYPAQTEQKKPPQSAGKPAAGQTQPKKTIPPPEKKMKKKKPRKKKESWLTFIERLKTPKNRNTETAPVINPMDEDYDGYYDDKPTDDNAQNRDVFEPELIKRVALISGGAIIIVIFAIILMFLL